MAETATELEEYFVTEACIACDACCDDFPDIFKMNDDHTLAIAYASTAKGTFNPWDIITVCPVDAISLTKGEMPPQPEGMEEEAEAELAPVELEDTRPWEIRWAEVKDLPENEWERMKRYGLASSSDETIDKYSFRFALPGLVPDHEYKFKWGLPTKMPDYKIDVQLDGQILKVKATLEDKRVKKLCSFANSFPDRFLRVLELPEPCKDITHNYNTATKILDIVVTKDVATEKAA